MDSEIQEKIRQYRQFALRNRRRKATVGMEWREEFPIPKLKLPKEFQDKTTYINCKLSKLEARCKFLIEYGEIEAYSVQYATRRRGFHSIPLETTTSGYEVDRKNGEYSIIITDHNKEKTILGFGGNEASFNVVKNKINSSMLAYPPRDPSSPGAEPISEEDSSSTSTLTEAGDATSSNPSPQDSLFDVSPGIVQDDSLVPSPPAPSPQRFPAEASSPRLPPAEGVSPQDSSPRRKRTKWSTLPTLQSRPISQAHLEPRSQEDMDAKESTETFSRLPKTVIPTNYRLRLKPNLETFAFEGEQEVTLTIEAESTEICMNAVDLKVFNITWVDSNGKPQLPTNYTLDEKDEVLKIEFSPALPVGTGTLNMSFTGELNDKLKGFYRSKYKGPEGQDRYNAVTQFEATDARRCFPCWDEPAIKATFDVTLVTPKNRVALSNMPIKSTKSYEEDESLQVLEYETTPIMSTYLLAFIVGEFDYLENYSSDGICCRVYTPVGKKEQGQFALDVCTRVLPYYKDYFGIAYPLPKMDLVAIADFSSGAMENWGLVTYRETALLVDKNESSATSRQWVAIVVGHELAHQWFGNLVTMEWWTHLWLNEGYATFVEFMCVEHLFPEYDIWTQFVTDTHNRALELDCLKNSHPIEVPVNHPREIDEIFDDISYSKGGSVIRMLYNFIGDADFKKGMNIYLTRHQYKNTFTEDLWRALAEASSKPVGDIMTTWTKQMGFPLIKVEEEKQDGNSRVLTLSQQKFWADPKLKSTFEKYNWMVPLTFSKGDDPKAVAQKVFFDKERITVRIDNVQSDEWVKVNPGTVGFYRVYYPSLDQFVNAIKSKEIPPLDRLGLVDDVFALVQAGDAKTVDVMKLAEAFIHEDNYTVWASISSIFGKLNLLMPYTKYHKEFKAYGRKIFSNIEKEVTWEPKSDEGHLRAMLRSLVLSRMISFDNEATRNEAKKRFERHMATVDRVSILPDLRSAVYKAVLSFAGQETLDQMLKLYCETDSQEEQDRISRALGAIKNPELLKQVLVFCISDKVRKQDTVFVLISVGMSKDGRELAWDFFKKNWQHFKDNYPCQHVARVIKYVIENFVTEEKATDVEKFFQEHEFHGTERTVQQSVEQIRMNEAWLKRDFVEVGEFLKTYELADHQQEL